MAWSDGPGAHMDERDAARAVKGVKGVLHPSKHRLCHLSCLFFSEIQKGRYSFFPDSPQCNRIDANQKLPHTTRPPLYHHTTHAGATRVPTRIQSAKI